MTAKHHIKSGSHSLLANPIDVAPAQKQSLCAELPTHRTDSDSGLSSAFSVLTQALPDEATQQAIPTAQSPASFSSSPSLLFWQRLPSTDSAGKGESTTAGSKEEPSAAARAASSSSSAWQTAAENVGLHAMVLRHMCQQSRDAQTEPNEASSAASCSYGSPGPKQASALLKTCQLAPSVWSLCQELSL